MESQASTSSKAFAVVYGILAMSFSGLLLLMLSTGHAFKDPQGVTLSVVAGIAAIISAVATWVKWHDTFPYRYGAPYPTSLAAKVIKAALGSYALTVATVIVAIVVGLYVVGQAAVNEALNYASGILAVLTAVFFPLVWRYMK